MGDVLQLRPRGVPHRILIAPEPFGHGFDVMVRPVPAGIGHDRELPTYADARHYAELIAGAMDWPIVDRCGGGEAA